MDFIKFKKIPRLTRECIITEKIDGTNGQIVIVDKRDSRYELENFNKWCYEYSLSSNENFNIFAGSRSRWLKAEKKAEDNHGFAKWVKENSEELFNLGEGHHYGEWWGQGINRGYGLEEKRYSLFNTIKWSDNKIRPNCCNIVPVLYEGLFDTQIINSTLNDLEKSGSHCARQYMNPEGIVIYHKASNYLFKKTIKDDDIPKGVKNEKT